MTAAIRVAGLTLTWPFAAAPTLDRIDLDIRPGERFLMLGPTGSGKSSLALTLNGLIPRSMRAMVTGQIDVGGHDPATEPVAAFAAAMSYLFQDSDSQFCTLTIEDEIAFALENRNLPPHDIDRRISAALARVGLPVDWRSRALATLSGGEKQKVALASVLAADNAILVLDEATSQLDPGSTRDTYAAIAELAADAARTIVFIDHKLEELIAHIDRVALISAAGALVRTETPRALFHDHYDEVKATGAWRPFAADLCAALRAEGVAIVDRPLSIDECRQALDRLDLPGQVAARHIVERRWPSRFTASERPETVIRLEQVHYAPPRAKDVVADVTLDVRRREILGIVGANGAGKSTLGLLLVGLLKPSRGQITAPARSRPWGRYVFQNPEHQFIAATVEGEILASLAASGPSPTAPTIAEVALRGAGLWPLRDQHPFQLSAGQKRRLSVLAMTVAPRTPILVLDEPSYGLDAAGVAELRAGAERWRSAADAVVVITHDMDLAWTLCDRLAVMVEGALAAIAPPETVFADRALLDRARLHPPPAWPLHEWARHG
jgi:energy-coupling factor transport system ATP-binding protein